MFSSRSYRLTTFLGMAAYLTASTFSGLLHDHVDAHCGHADSHRGTAGCCRHADMHDAEYACPGRVCPEHAEHAGGHAGLGVLPTGKMALHDDGCAACRFVSQRVMPAANVLLVDWTEWSVELSAVRPSPPFTTAKSTTHSRAPPLFG